MANQDPESVVLPVQRVTTLRPTGTTWHLTVACPAQGHLVDGEECASCARLRHLLPPDEEGRSWIVCEPAAAPRAPGLEEARVGDVMTADVVCVGDELPVHELVTLFAETGFSSAPVVDAEGRPIGIVSKADVTRLAPELRARSVMSPTVVLGDATPLPRAARAMAAAGAHAAPVLDHEGRVVGILSALDVLAWLGDEPAPDLASTR